ncbi:MAG: peptidoglycan recognition protein family protein [Cyanobacteria bacterium REEB459]|nr:peptidoglycan recognition protein family protein [Cyanobacteria bacterium REEB459]
MTRSWLVGLCSCLLVLALGLGNPPLRAAAPLQPLSTVVGLPDWPGRDGTEIAPDQGRESFMNAQVPGGGVPSPPVAPRLVQALAHSSNYGDRFLTDARGEPVHNEFIVVLHETVASAQSALNLFRTAHPRDQDQVSYHSLIGRDGTIYYIVPPEKRAFGAGNSVFDGPEGPETVLTNPSFPPSVNNFAYHVSLETPRDGFNNRLRHSGYTRAQYYSLAWLLAQTTVPDHRITTHQAVDRSGTRRDPRSFNLQRCLTLLRRYPSRAVPVS